MFVTCRQISSPDNGTKKNVTYIVLELAGGGELFDFIAQSGKFTESIARYYFK